MDIATVKKDLKNQIGSINEDLKNIYLPLEAVLILMAKRTAFQIAIELIDSLQQEQKPAEWSEEDEKKIHFLSRLIEFQVKNDEYCFSEGRFVSKKEAIKMLKSLRPCWKPSEEQMEVLLNIEGDLRAFQYNDKAKIIAELYEQLKRL